MDKGGQNDRCRLGAVAVPVAAAAPATDPRALPLVLWGGGGIRPLRCWWGQPACVTRHAPDSSMGVRRALEGGELLVKKYRHLNMRPICGEKMSENTKCINAILLTNSSKNGPKIRN